MLTAKQEKFVQGLVKGLSQRQAYKEAYDAEKMQDNSIDTEAWKLLQNTEISQRYNELMSKLEDETILTVKEKRRMYREFAKDINLSMTDRLKAMDQDSKLGGEYTTKVEASVSYENTLKEVVSEDEY